jgi:voltage-gated potassium channel Kch
MVKLLFARAWKGGYSAIAVMWQFSSRATSRVARAIADSAQTISSVNPLIFLSIYFSIIPIFAGLFQLDQENLFSPYAQFEPRALGYTKKLQDDVVKNMKDNLYYANTRHYGIPIDPENIEMLNSWMSEHKLYFGVRVHYGYNNPTQYVTATIELNPFQLTSIDTGQTFSIANIEYPPGQRNLEKYRTDLEPLDDILGYGPYPIQDVRVFILPQEDRDIFHKLLTGYSGRPEYGDFESYLRMLYFSIMTITTVGYGDLIPLSPFLRMLAASEAVLGWLLAGLFLNAVAWTASQRAALKRDHE